jgi:hypothetical protein
MIFAHLTQHWMARRRQHSLSAWWSCVASSLRVLAHYRDHRSLCGLRVYRNHVAATNADPFHHLSHRDYLIKGLSPRQRVHAVLSHYRFEDATFDEGYLGAVYGRRSLPLWQHEADGSTFTIQLEMTARGNAEGDLTIALVADGRCLHRLSFNWLPGDMAGVGLPVVPFIARNEGRWADSGPAFDAFERVFPNNSPSFFCFAAMQGVALALGMDKIVGIRAEAHVAYDPDPDKHFANAYDGFWKILGGTDMPGRDGYLIALPFYVKPLAEMPSKHRKRAALRREHWRLIGDSAQAVIQRHVLPARARVTREAAIPEPA